MKNLFNILLIEDDKYFALHLKEILSPFGLVTWSDDIFKAKSLLLTQHFDIIVTDMHLGENTNGLEVLRDVCQYPNTIAIVVSSSEEERLIEKAYDLGAHHFLTKENIRENLPPYIRSLLSSKRTEFIKKILAEEFLTQDVSLIQEITALSQVNWQGKSLFLSGPTGVGKSLFGKILHQICFPATTPFIHINCSEIPENLLESELFGHEKGAFTGAEQKKIGKIKLADGGVLFLDEVGTMSLPMQQKLLKAIDEKTFYPLGSQKVDKSNFTLISATCENLEEKIKQGSFRLDFYYRLKGFELNLKALKERKNDLPLIIKYLQKKSNRKFIIKPEALKALESHTWPGNIRELQKIIDQLASMPKGVVEATDVLHLLSSTGGIKENSEQLISAEALKFIENHGLRSFIELVEKAAAEKSLQKHQGKITSCIKELKISASAFYRILQQNKLDL